MHRRLFISLVAWAICVSVLAAQEYREVQSLSLNLLSGSNRVDVMLKEVRYDGDPNRSYRSYLKLFVYKSEKIEQPDFEFGPLSLVDQFSLFPNTSIVVARQPGTAALPHLFVFSFDGQKLSFKELELPQIDSKNYGGKDSFQSSNSIIIRTFPLYKEGDAGCCPSGGVSSIKYALKKEKLMVLK